MGTARTLTPTLTAGTVGTAHGTFKFPEVVASTPSEEWELKILTDGEDPSAMRMLNPTGSLEET